MFLYSFLTLLSTHEAYLYINNIKQEQTNLYIQLITIYSFQPKI